MIRLITKTADAYGITGIKRVAFYIVAPFVMVISYAAGLVTGFVKATISTIKEKI